MSGLSAQQRRILRAIADRPHQPWPAWLAGDSRHSGHCVFWPLWRAEHPTASASASRSRALRRLEERGLVVRHRGQRDTYRVSLTDAGARVAASLTVARGS